MLGRRRFAARESVKKRLFSWVFIFKGARKNLMIYTNKGNLVMGKILSVIDKKGIYWSV
jgi:hypothetical protein